MQSALHSQEMQGFKRDGYHAAVLWGDLSTRLPISRWRKEPRVSGKETESEFNATRFLGNVARLI